jgi:TonB family protein
MLTCLLKRVLPFMLTFAVGAALGWLFNFSGAGGRFAEVTTRLERREAPFGYGYGRSYRMYRRNLVAETKPLVVLEQPPAIYTTEAKRHSFGGAVRLSVTFGADGTIKNIERLRGQLYGLTEAAERAAWRIKFIPATENGLPITVTRTIEYDFPSELTRDEDVVSPVFLPEGAD